MQEPDSTLFPLDHLALRGDPNATALISRDRMLSYAELDQRVGALAALLHAKGLKAGDRVASWLPKTVEACLMPLAAVRAGLIHVPVNPALRKAQVEHILSDSGAALLLTSESRASLLNPSLCPVWEEQDAMAADPVNGYLAASSVDPQTLAAILYTSGSTGRPKGVMLSHANLWLGAVSVAHYLGISPHDRILGVLPLSFDYGQNQLFSSWYAGASVAPLDYLSARDVIKAVDRHGITTLAGVPPLWVQLLDASWPEDAAASLTRLTNSGGALTPTLIKKMRQSFPNARIFPMYGLTEAFRSTYLDPELVDAHPNAVGKAIPFAEVLIVRPDGSSCEAGEAGELVHAGPLVAQGYWLDEQRTAQRFKPAPAQSRYGGIAVWSGDKAVADADGLISFIGRDDEMIKSSGNRISPTEIEEAAERSGVVMESVAIGVPDDRLGQAILLVAVGKGDDPEPKLREWFRSELPAFMHPRDVIWRDELPRNPNGKLDRAGLRQEYAA
ncbi:MAG: acyl-CoA ligase (AMP-forming), exosortase A system-associated [Sphingomonadales bacterium]|nr:acyl-CoA ligase (AMP-forming), exosortase A system-associated [Sphingomonadales bacterium]